MTNRIKVMMAGLMVLASQGVYAAGTDGEVIAHLKDAKITLLQGIAQAEKSSGPVTSAKFEMDGSDLSLSIYTAPQGLNTPAEDNDLTELAGSATVSPYAPSAEVFADKQHIARASVHLAVRQMSVLSLSEIIEEALEVQAGTPYSVANPMIRNGEPVADVFIADKNGKSVKVTVNVRTGEVCY
jgi:hypothetical protein